MRRKHVVRTLALVSVISLAAAACGDSGGKEAGSTTTPAAGGATTTTSSTTPAPKAGGSIKMGMFSETAGLDPVVTNGGGTTGTTEIWPSTTR